jgi:hypothetical protein
MQTLSALELETMTCRELELEIARTREFLDEIEATGFDGRDVLAILGDFGIGNMMERSDAIKSGKERLEQLEQLKIDRGCP